MHKDISQQTPFNNNKHFKWHSSATLAYQQNTDRSTTMLSKNIHCTVCIIWAEMSWKKPTPQSDVHTGQHFTQLNNDKTISSRKRNFRNTMQHQRCQRHTSIMSFHALSTCCLQAMHLHKHSWNIMLKSSHDETPTLETVIGDNIAQSLNCATQRKAKTIFIYTT